MSKGNCLVPAGISAFQRLLQGARAAATSSPELQWYRHDMMTPAAIEASRAKDISDSAQLR